MKKFQKIFNTVSVMIAVSAIIFVMSFVSERINEFRTRQNVIKSNVNYVLPDKSEPKRYEQILTEKTIVKEIKKDAEKEEVTVNTGNNSDFSRFINNVVKNYSENLTYNDKTKDYRSHNGIDIRTEEPVTAIYSGIIEIVRNTKEATVDLLLKSANGETAVYKDIELIESLADGSEVKVNEILGYTSENNGFIFHLGIIKNEKFINPTEIFK